MTTAIEEHVSSKESRAKRLKKLRKMCGLTRKSFAEKYRISASNFQNWEGPRYGGLTESAAIKCIECFKQEGILSTLEWLMYGSGPPPSILSTAFSMETASSPANQPLAMSPGGMQSQRQVYNLPETVKRELEQFKKFHPDALAYIQDDDSMSPYFHAGEVVAGVPYHSHQLVSASHQDCIIQLNSGKTILRRMVPDEHSNRYHLLAHNLKSQAHDLVCYQSNIVKAAPVIWRRIITT